jgi:serine/threonine protein kinase
MIPARPPPILATPQDFSSAFNKFIARCLTKDPNQRPSAAELLQVMQENNI